MSAATATIVVRNCMLVLLCFRLLCAWQARHLGPSGWRAILVRNVECRTRPRTPRDSAWRPAIDPASGPGTPPPRPVEDGWTNRGYTPSQACDVPIGHVIRATGRRHTR